MLKPEEGGPDLSSIAVLPLDRETTVRREAEGAVSVDLDDSKSGPGRPLAAGPQGTAIAEGFPTEGGEPLLRGEGKTQRPSKG